MQMFLNNRKAITHILINMSWDAGPIAYTITALLPPKQGMVETHSTNLSRYHRTLIVYQWFVQVLGLVREPDSSVTR